MLVTLQSDSSYMVRYLQAVGRRGPDRCRPACPMRCCPGRRQAGDARMVGARALPGRALARYGCGVRRPIVARRRIAAHQGR